MSTPAFLFLYLVAAILAMQKPVLILWGIWIYLGLVFRSVWISWGR